MNLLRKDGKLLVVLRPTDPQLALELLKNAQLTQIHADFDAILQAQPYTLMGFLGEDQEIYDEHLRHIGSMKSGDSMVTSDHVIVRGLKMPE